MELALSIIGLALSFFFAGSETAFVSTNKFRFEIWLRRNLKRAIAANPYFKKPDIFLSITLVGNNISSIMASSYATVYLIAYLDKRLAWIIITLILLLFGEIVPKVIFRTHADSIILRIIYLIRFFHYLFKPIIALAGYITNRTLRILRIGHKEEKYLLDKNEIMVLLKEAKISGIVDETEHKIISRVLDLPKKLVREAMIPRISINAINFKSGLKGLKQMITRTGNTKIPIFDGSIDNIIGVAFLYDLFLMPASLREMMKPIIYTPENKKCNELLREFKATNSSIAVVIDEYGGTAGIVTLEDLMEELFGEIDEFSLDSIKPVRALNKTTYLVDAKEPLESVNELLDIDLPEGNYETLAGYITTRLGYIPRPGEIIPLKNSRIIITRSSRKRIEQVRIVKKEMSQI
jgi:putative hemolysin